MIYRVEDLMESVEDIFEIKDKGKLYCGKLKIIISREEILNLGIVLYDNKSFKITGIEAPCIPCPLRQGLSIGLLMVEIPSILIDK